jgi:hypothetical protein
MLFHRINGWLVILLICIGNAGALMIARRAFGGGLPIQAGVGTLVIITSVSMFMAVWNIKHLQIDQHRAWMLRTMFVMGTIITTRFIMIIQAQIVTMIGSYYTTMTCGEINFIQSDNLSYVAERYPACIGGDEAEHVVVHADFGTNPEEIGASLRIGFGMALWLAIFLHLAGVEIYLRLTPREASRLRQVSYERQLEAGFKNPGFAGLVVEKFGDAEPWQPQGLEQQAPTKDRSDGRSGL